MRILTSRPVLTACNTLYRATGGVLGAWWFGQPILLLTTVGRRTGERRVSGLVFLRDGGRYVVVASDNGAASRPGWYFNLLASGGGAIQYRRTRQVVTAHEAEGEERERLWPPLLQVYSGYDRHQARAGRPLPVMVLTPVTS
ncbi:nitroreductase/quinone reductase family protein [Streptacidiphilus carbonis]|uniref:nitroreductase/quinone reductase family protein n=1 Tax=Streptacidiphilus carbonis TaxID=105422 RepID=UPI0006931DF5|nr:nitroreductase/quinone reductase family protein [Streptacidiphilus carbonis]